MKIWGHFLCQFLFQNLLDSRWVGFAMAFFHDLSDKIFRYIFKGIESTDNIDLDDAEEFAERIEEFMMEEYRNSGSMK